jgi:5-methylcytosine-specific restriction endonuclease McrA
MTIATYSVSVLNASYEGLGSTKLDRALNLVIHGKAEIVEYVEGREIRSMSGMMFNLPKVIRLLKYVRVPFHYSEEYFSKGGVLRRDNFTCGYCGKGAANGLTMTHDHILPKSRGGQDTWMNAITACTKCNSKKADRTPEEANMPLLFQPEVPMRIYFKSEKPRRRKKNK